MSKRIVLLLLILAAAGAARAQSLADVARKEEERRKTLPDAGKVYTNKDLTAPPGGASPPPAEKSSRAGDPAKDADKAAKDAKDAKDKDAKDKGPAKDQAYWAGRLKTLRDQLLRDQNYADAMQTRINSLTTDFVNRDDPAQRAVIERDRQKSIAELARLTKSAQDTKKAIADLQEEARRAAVPPGWLR